MRALVLASALILLGACGQEAGPNASGGSQDEERSWRVIDWPATKPGPAVSCVYDYPADLPDREIAFDGTITRVRMGTYDEDAGATPARLELEVNEVFTGTLAEVVTMRTWDFMLPDEDVTDVRILAAAGPTLDLMGCGFSRPYSVGEAREWREAFGDGPSN
jgi:hypothetical protein